MRSFYDFYNKLYLEASVHPVILKDSESIIKKAIQTYFSVKNPKSDHPDFEDFVISSKNKNNELKDVDILLSFSLTDIDEEFNNDNEEDKDYKYYKFPNFEEPIKPNDFYHLSTDEEEEQKQSDYQKKLDDANKAPDIGGLKNFLLKNLENFEPHNHIIKIYVDLHKNATYEKVADVLTKEIMNEIQKIINSLD
jgi:hypothetical protein